MTFSLGVIPAASYAEAVVYKGGRHVTVNLAELGALHVIGSPGEGKSTFLGRLADACVNAGEGVLLLDPKGDLAEEVANRTAHPDQLIYLAPGAYPDDTFCLNVLEIPANHPQTSTLQEIVGNNLQRMFHHMGKYDPDFMSMIDTYLRAAVKTAYTKRNPTLVDVIGILISQVERDQAVAATRRPDIELFWSYYEARTPTDRRYQIDSTLRRLWEFLMDVRTYFFIANPTSTIHLADWIDQGKLVVVNLATGLHEDDAERIGNLLVAYLSTQYRFRASKLMPWDRTRRWRLIVDEFWRFAANPYTQILRDGRAFNFYPVVAHQDMGQLERLGDKWDVPKALGHASELSFRRSRAELPPGPPEVQQAFLARQQGMKLHEADWTVKSPTGTTATLVRMDQWTATVHATGEAAALEAARIYTLPKSTVPSLRERLEAWRQGGTTGKHAKPSQPKPTQPAPPRPHEPRPERRPAPDGGDAVRPADGAAHPGRPRPPRPHDGHDAPGSLFPRPPRPGVRRDAEKPGSGDDPPGGPAD